MNTTVYHLVVMDRNPFTTGEEKVNQFAYRFPNDRARHYRQRDEESRGRFCVSWQEEVPVVEEKKWTN